MITSKQRAVLRGIANGVQASFNVGKGGINDNMLADISSALDAHEIVKLNVLRNADVDARDIIDGLAGALNADAVSAIGNKITLYRRSAKDGVKHIELEK